MQAKKEAPPGIGMEQENSLTPLDNNGRKRLRPAGKMCKSPGPDDSTAESINGEIPGLPEAH